MINIVHFADSHIGMENYGKLNEQTGLNTRLEDFLDAFDEIVNYTISENIDLVIFAGDGFKNQNPTSTHQEAFANRIKRLSKAGIPTVLLVGNHDQANRKGEIHALEIYETLEIDNVFVIDKPDIVNVKTKQGTIQVAGLPYVSSSFLLRKEEYQSKSQDEIKSILLDKVQSIINYFEVQLDKNLPRILTAHLSVNEATLGSEQDMMLGKGFGIPISLLANPVFNYVALGHIHKFQVLSETPPVVYSGSIERVDFGEEKEEKGFVHVTLDNNNCSYKFIHVNSRPFITFKFDLTDIEDPMEYILNEIEKAKVKFENTKAPVVRLEYSINSQDAYKINDKDIYQALSFAIYTIIQPKIITQTSKIRLTFEENKINNPLASLEDYLSWHPDYKEVKEELLQLANELLNRL